MQTVFQGEFGHDLLQGAGLTPQILDLVLTTPLVTMRAQKCDSFDGPDDGAACESVLKGR